MTDAFIKSLNRKTLYINPSVDEDHPRFEENLVFTFKDGNIYVEDWYRYRILCAVKDLDCEIIKNKFRYSVETEKFDIKRFCQELICYSLENHLLNILDEWLDEDFKLYCIIKDDETGIYYKDCFLNPINWWA